MDDEIVFTSWGETYTATWHEHPDRLVVDCDWADLVLYSSLEHEFPLTIGSLNAGEDQPFGAREALHRLEALRYNLIRAYLNYDI